MYSMHCSERVPQEPTSPKTVLKKKNPKTKQKKNTTVLSPQGSQ